MNTKDVIQKEALVKWTEPGPLQRRGTVVIPTGMGKTRVGVLAYLSCPIERPKTLVIVTKINLIDDPWKTEFESMMVNHTDIDFMCIQSAHKIDKEYDLVIIDEVHRSLSPSFRQVFQNVKTKWLIGLTATPPEDEEQLTVLNTVAPIVYYKKLSEIASEGEAYSDFYIYNVAVGMDKKTKSTYNVFNTKFNEASIRLAEMRQRIPRLKVEYKDIFLMAKAINAKPSLAGVNEDLVKWSKQFWFGMTMRKMVVYSNREKIKATKAILAKDASKRKWILFTKSITFAEALSEEIPDSIVYHSKMKKHERESTLEAFKEGTYNILIAVDALNEGFNVPDVDGAICVSGVSTAITAIQQLGRVIRFKEGKRAIFINLYTEDTVEQNWVMTKTKTANLEGYTKWLPSVAALKL